MLHRHLARGDLDDETIFDAVCMRLSATIESLGAIEDVLREQAFASDWPAIWSVRNRIAHGYIQVDRQVIVGTVTHPLPRFEEQIARLALLVASGTADV
jgi:uncharacterized protein with HEPN domain